MKSLQEVYDIVLHALRKQGKPSLNTDGSCVYRGSDDCKCAVGHLIPDDLYDSRMEGDGVQATLVLAALIKADMPVTTQSGVNLFWALQAAHDNALKRSMAEWEDEMKAIAAMYNLTYTPPN